jgi:hypothetical protein
LRSDLEAACEGLTGNARKIMQVISEDPGITIESLATLVKLTPYGIRYHLAGLAKSVGLHHSSDRKGGEWEVTGPKKRAQEAGSRNGDSRHPVEGASQGPSQKTSKKTTKENEATSKKTSKKTIKKTGQVFLLPDGLSDAARKIA